MSVSPLPGVAGRQALPDQLRGFALLGIVVVNMPFLGLTNDGLGAASGETPLDAVVAFAIVALAQGKFYLLFSFLFGYSLTLILRETGRASTSGYARRLVGLTVLGLLHAVLFFIGDILMSYALLGAVLLIFVRRSTRTILISAGVSFALALVLLSLIAFTATEDALSSGIISDPGALDAILATGTFAEAAGARAGVLPEALLFQAVINWLPAFAMFLLGLAAGRTRLLADPQAYGPVWRWMASLGLALGLPLGALSAWLVTASADPTGVDRILGVALGFGTAPFLTAGYVALFALTTSGRAARWFEPAGRMSLTGYLGESIVLSAIFCGWGLGLFGQVGVATGAAIALATWLALDVFAGWWLKRLRYGPFEYVLRWWSTLRRPQMTSTSGR